jgi:hypothetical protein
MREATSYARILAMARAPDSAQRDHFVATTGEPARCPMTEVQRT